MAEKIKTLRVIAGEVEAGTLTKGPQFSFQYTKTAQSKDAVSLVMPVVERDISRNALHPVFEMNLPEGYLRQRIVEQFRKHAKVDEMFFLALQGASSIGRLGFESENSEPKSALYLPELIVKTSGPEFYLSEDKRLFIMRRFDITHDGRRLGMEDICVLMGIPADDKYDRSYEQVARAIKVFSEDPNSDLETFFRSLCVSVLVGNGDAHLKNFAMLYDAPSTGKGCLSPMYDIVNTTVYQEGDTMALKLSKTRDFPNRTTMIRFGREHCHLTDKMAQATIDQCIYSMGYGAVC